MYIHVQRFPRQTNGQQSGDMKVLSISPYVKWSGELIFLHWRATKAWSFCKVPRVTIIDMEQVELYFLQSKSKYYKRKQSLKTIECKSTNAQLKS